MSVPAVLEQPAAPVHLYSSIQLMALAAMRLPEAMRALYEANFVQGKTPEEVCEEMQITREQFEQRRGELLRSLRAVVGSTLAEKKSGNAH